MRNVISGQMKVEQAPFALVIVKCYLTNLSVEHNLSQKLDVEAVAIVVV